MRSETNAAISSSYQASQASFGAKAGWAKVPPPEPDRGDGAHSSFDQVVINANAELAQLSGILRQLGCAAQLRHCEGTVQSQRTSAHGDPAEAFERTPSVPIYDPKGRAQAALDLTRSEKERPDAPDKLLRVLLEWAAAAITERWFRMHYHQYWIIAARAREAMDAGIVVAADGDQMLVGADRSARQLLRSRGLNAEAGPPLSAIFEVGAAVFKDGPGPDLVRVLRGCHNDAEYSVVITPPDPAAVESSHDQRLLLHTRPRLFSISCAGAIASREQPLRPLGSQILRSIVRHIDTHLDTALGVDTLAAQAGLSVSYFSRCFHKSVGITPHSYILRRRLLRAQQLLAQSQMSLTNVALTAGFSDQSHFCRRFREFVGVTPRAFRARYR